MSATCGRENKDNIRGIYNKKNPKGAGRGCKAVSKKAQEEEQTILMDNSSSSSENEAEKGS